MVAGDPPDLAQRRSRCRTGCVRLFAVTVTAPDGTVVESETWDHGQGVERSHVMVTCGFIIPVGPSAP